MTDQTVPLSESPAISPIGFGGIPEYVSKNGDQIRGDLRNYFTSYTGRWFEHFSRLGAATALDANDLAACAALSVPFDGPTLSSLWSRVDDINALLTRAPGRDVALVDVDVEGDQYKALNTLYELLRNIPGMGMVRTSKLLASKRPHLVPIRDSYVDALLGTPPTWWSEWRRIVENAALVSEVTELAGGVVPADTSLLRIFDILLWTEADRRIRASRQ